MIKFIYTFFKYFIEKEIPEVKTVDLFFNQFEEQYNGNEDNKANPRVLIEINESTPEQYANGYQQWIQEVTLHIGIDIYDQFNSDKTMDYLDLLDNIYKKLNGLSSFTFPEELHSDDYQINDVVRTNIMFATNVGNIKVSQITFQIVFEDYSLIPEKETTMINNEEITVNVINVTP